VTCNAVWIAECCATDKKIEQRMSVTEMRMLSRSNGVARKDKVRNEYIRGIIGVAPIVDKIR